MFEINFTESILSDDIVDYRSSICDACTSKKLGICLECGCVLITKTRFAFSSCPLDKWKQVILPKRKTDDI